MVPVWFHPFGAWVARRGAVQVLDPATEDEMVLEFLRAEIANVPEWARSIVNHPTLGTHQKTSVAGVF
jgi:hypothetical protein